MERRRRRRCAQPPSPPLWTEVKQTRGWTKHLTHVENENKCPIQQQPLTTTWSEYKRKYLLLAKDVENKQKMLKSLSVSLLSFPKIGSLAHTPMEVSNASGLNSSIWMALIFVADIYIRRNIQIVGLRLVKPKNIFVDLYVIK